MKLNLFQKIMALVVLNLAIFACSLANPVVVPNATQVSGPNDGPAIVTGTVTYTNSFFTAGVAEPEVILEDQGGFVTRDRKFLIPVESQVIGQMTSDFYN